MKRIHIGFRIALAVGAVLILACYYLPLWSIFLWAPQYPEGLSIQVWHNALTGDVEVINGLNHYIGMKKLKAEMFPEFQFLKYVIAGFIGLTLFTAWKGNLRWLKIYCVIILISGCVALADFYRWGYDYGHNLDPTAPIQVPGMAYQPPVLGYKVLLNFTALSIPASGGWLVVGVGALAYVILALTWIPEIMKKRAALAIVPAAMMLFGSCAKHDPVIHFGKDNCDFCRMTIMDQKFGAALTTEKGRDYRFDDIKCMNAFVSEGDIAVKKAFVVVHDVPGTLVLQETASYCRGESIRSPMGGGVAAFSSADACKGAQQELPGECLSYQQLTAN